jgi:hypothetical protein
MRKRHTSKGFLSTIQRKSVLFWSIDGMTLELMVGPQNASVYSD